MSRAPSLSSTSTPMLVVEKLQVSYGPIRALHEVSLTVHQGEIVTLLGANGAGKTSTLRAISGLVKASGRLEFEGRSLVGVRAHEIVRWGLSHSPEGRRIFAGLDVRENLEMGSYIRSRKTAAEKQAFEEDLEYVFTLFPRLKERLSQLGGTLSGGEQQMLAVSRALMQRPKLLMLDEPSLGIAPNLVENILRALRAINQKGTTILLVEQNAAAALSIAHRAYVIETGRTTLSGTAKELASNPKVREAYLG